MIIWQIVSIKEYVPLNSNKYIFYILLYKNIYMYPYRSKDTPLHHPLVSNGSDFLTTSAPVGRIAKYCTIQQCRFLQAFCLKKQREPSFFSPKPQWDFYFSACPPLPLHPHQFGSKQKKQHNKYLAGKRTPKQYEFIY